MANLEANVSMNRCQHVSKDQNKSSDQCSVLDTQVFRSYTLPHADPYNPKSTTRSDLLERGHGKRKHSLESRLPRSKMQGMASLCLWLHCQYLLLPIHHSLRGHVHEAQLRVLINCSWCLKHITLEHSLKAEPQKVGFLNGESSRWKPGMTPARKSERWNDKWNSKWLQSAFIVSIIPEMQCSIGPTGIRP